MVCFCFFYLFQIFSSFYNYMWDSYYKSRKSQCLLIFRSATWKRQALWTLSSSLNSQLQTAMRRVNHLVTCLRNNSSCFRLSSSSLLLSSSLLRASSCCCLSSSSRCRLNAISCSLWRRRASSCVNKRGMCGYVWERNSGSQSLYYIIWKGIGYMPIRLC